MLLGAVKYEAPAITKSAFNCPTCQVLTTQYWFTCGAEAAEKNNKPKVFVWDDDFQKSLNSIENKQERVQLEKIAKRLQGKLPFLREMNFRGDHILHNLWFSRCYECDAIAVWAHETLIWPRVGAAPLPNADLPPEVRRDYDEASTILDASPRGAAALLRYAIQELCKFLGEPGKHLDTDISSLVKKGLDVRIQRALDIVRVIGNNAVHPGQIDMRDNRDTAEKLFRLVNLITEKMITEQKHIDEMYLSLPEGAREAIEKRDKGK